MFQKSQNQQITNSPKILPGSRNKLMLWTALYSFFLSADSKSSPTLTPVSLLVEREKALINAFQIELTSARPIRLHFKNDNSTKVHAYLRSSCHDFNAGKKIGSLIKGDKLIAIFVDEVTKSIDTRETAPTYPPDFPLKWLRGSSDHYDSDFCHKICWSFGRWVLGKEHHQLC